MERKQRLWLPLVILLAAILTGSCDDEGSSTENGAHNAAVFDSADDDGVAPDANNGHDTTNSGFFPPPVGEFGHYDVKEFSGFTQTVQDWRLDISRDSATFAGEMDTVLAFNDASGSAGTNVKVWADLSSPMSAVVRQIEFHQSGALNGVDWWPMEELDSDLRITFDKPLALDFSGQVGAIVMSAGSGSITLNGGQPVDATFTASTLVMNQDITVEIPYGTVDHVKKVAMDLGQSTAEGSASLSGSFYLHPDLGIIAADLDGGIESVALTSASTTVP